MLSKSYSIVLKFLLNIFYYLIARAIGFLAMYHDGVLHVTYHDREALMGSNMPFLECYAVALLFLSFYTVIVSCPSINKFVDNW